MVRNRKHPFNLVRIQVVAFDSYSAKPHVPVGSVAFHLHDIIKVRLDSFLCFAARAVTELTVVMASE